MDGDLDELCVDQGDVHPGKVDQASVQLGNLRQVPERDKLQGAFFNFSPLNLANTQSLYEIPHSNFFSPILILDLGLSQI